MYKEPLGAIEGHFCKASDSRKDQIKEHKN